MLERISINPKICHNKPCIKGTRIMVWQIIDLIESGYSFDEIISEHFPQITKEDIQACLHYANKLVKNEEVYFYDDIVGNAVSG